MNGTVAGFCVIAGLRAADSLVELRRMVVDPPYRGRGLGRSLLRSMTRRAYMAGARRVWLDVKPDNERALALYESEDFIPTSTIADAGATDELIVLVHAPPK